MIYITGDTHIPIDIHKLSTKNFSQQKNMTKNDYLIICGDFGGVWDNSNEEKYWIKWLEKKPWTTLFVDGNHENFDLLYSYPITEWNGGKIHQISDSIFHLMRGQIFVIEGSTFFTMGGASSHDKIYRKENISWWEKELPMPNEYEEALNALEKNNWTVDYVISHCVADSIQSLISPWFEHDKETNFFETILFLNNFNFKKWFFGHYHIDKEINSNFIALYNNVILLKE